MKLNQIFTDGMVLQANKPIRLFGTGKGSVKATFGDSCVGTTSDQDSWFLELPAMPYGGPYEMTVDLNGSITVIRDIYIGEVILLAGQSNIYYRLKNTSFKETGYEEENLLRCFAAELGEWCEDFSPADGWVHCTRQTVPDFSAIGYHLGMQLCREKGVAVGLITCCLGSTVIESWMPQEISAQERFYLPKEEKYDSPYVRGAYNKHGTLYNLTQQSIVPYTLGNVIWYQGESNTGSGEWKIYTDLLEALILCWREDFMDKNLPFTVIEIADWDQRDDAAWHGIQAAQRKIADRLEYVKAVRSSDVCETFDIHPPTKIRLAQRVFESIFCNS